jgi:hypothetical protein
MVAAMTGEPYLGDIFHRKLSRDERRRLEATYPKCACGCTIGKQRHEEGETQCRQCQAVTDERQARDALLERALGATTVDELRAVVLEILERLPQ